MIATEFDVRGYRWTDIRENLLVSEAVGLALWLRDLAETDVRPGPTSGRLQQMGFIEPNLEFRAIPHWNEVAFEVMFDLETRPPWKQKLPDAEAFLIGFRMRVPTDDVLKASSSLQTDLRSLGVDTPN